MIQSRLDDNFNKVKTKEELLELLKQYKGILNQTTFDYLNSLLGLEFSVTKDCISDSDRKVLAELDVYRKIAIYNIYNKTKNLFNSQNAEYIILGNNEGFEGLHVSTRLDDRKIKLFDFNYGMIHVSDWNNCGTHSFETLDNCYVTLFQTIENKELIEAELDRIMNVLEKLYDERNPFHYHRGRIGGPGTTWIYDHERKIQLYEKMFNELDGKKELSDDDKKEIEITHQIHDLLLKDFDLTSESFIDEDSCIAAILGNKVTKLNKTFVKRIPNCTITDYIKYI